MPLIEIEDQYLSALAQQGVRYTDATPKAQRMAQLEKAFTDLNGGEHRHDWLALLEKQYPELKHPELHHPAISKVNELEAKLAKMEEERLERERKAEEEARTSAAHKTVAEGRTWLRRQKQLDDEGVEAIEKLMQEHQIPNYEIAYNHWSATQPPPPIDLPSAYGGPSLDWFKADESQPDGQLLLKDPEAFKVKERAKVMNELRAARLRAA